MDKQLGLKIKELRNSQGLTLKDLSEKTGLSISFLSQVERGLTSVAIISLQNIAEALGVDLTYFFTPPIKHDTGVIRSYEQEAFRVDDTKFIYHSLAGGFKERMLDPTLTVLLPGQSREDVTLISHDGEEFGYVLEGILTFFIGDKEYQLYPGDSVHIPSKTPHNWANFTNKLVKVIWVNTPKIFD